MSVISLMGTVGLLKTPYIYYFIEIKDGFSGKKKIPEKTALAIRQ